MAQWETVAELEIDAASRIYEHGWQSWSPSTAYGMVDRPHRPRTDRYRVMCYRPDAVAPRDAFWGEGLFATALAEGGPVYIASAPEPEVSVPSIRGDRSGDHLVISANGPVSVRADSGPGGLEGALARWAGEVARRAGVERVRPAPTAWCSWYYYYTAIAEDDVRENLDAIESLGLPVDVVQVDDGYQAEIGDWLTPSPRFPDLSALLGEIRARGRTAGLWTAPFLVGARSEIARRRADWLVRGDDGRPVWVGHNWDQDLHALDVTHPDAAGWLGEVYGRLRTMGVEFHKLDFLYAGAVPGSRHEGVPALEAYRRGLLLIREAAGDSAYLLGCGAPILPSIGLVDAMRVSPDIGAAYEPPDGDLSQASQRAAALTGRARQFMNGRFWTNDPDCLMARPTVEHRDEWAAHVEQVGGLVASGDRLRELDEWGLTTTRRLLAGASARSGRIP